MSLATCFLWSEVIAAETGSGKSLAPGCSHHLLRKVSEVYASPGAAGAKFSRGAWVVWTLSGLS